VIARGDQASSSDASVCHDDTDGKVKLLGKRKDNDLSRDISNKLKKK
jgi:hypothetical protein